jgi:hypothetical protein
MSYVMKKVFSGALASVAALCLGGTGAASAAQPDAAASVARSPGNPGHSAILQVPAASSQPGTLKAFKAFKAIGTEVVANTPLTFSFQGSGHCKVKLSGGDGYARDIEGDLPFSAAYTYGTGSMSSFEAFKDYSASAIALGNCKAISPLPAIKVRVTNPNPQGVPASGAQGPVISSTNPGLTVTQPKP